MGKNTLFRIVNLIISLLFFLFEIIFVFFKKLFGIRIPGMCIVLCYHSIPKNGLEKFIRQMDLLSKFTTPLHVGFRGALAERTRFSVVTFDDGFISVVENALPVLSKRNIGSAIFVPSCNLNLAPKWLQNTRNEDRDEIVMTIDHLKRIDCSLVTIGSHSLTHADLTKLTIASAKKEIFESKAVLEKITKRKVEYFAFPYGKYSHELLLLAKEARYSRVFTLQPNPGFQEKNEFKTGRYSVSPRTWLIEFFFIIFGAYRWHTLAGTILKIIKF
jgi:peptidoglycan/xylan/chitin deacetylase (PgdA/CDA1 family)